LSVYSTANPNCSGSLAKRCTSGAFWRSCANSFSNSLWHGTRLKMHLSAASVVRDQGNGAVSERGRPACRSCGSNSEMTSFRKASTNVFTVTYWATLLLIALIIAGSFNVTGSPNALVSRNSLTFGANAENCDGNLI